MKRFLLYCFYNKDGIAADYVLYFLEKIKPFFAGICIVVNGSLSDKTKEQFIKYTDEILIRENVGFDAGAYKYFINTYGVGYLRQYDEVILANDTFYGPLFDLNNLFAKMEAENTDFWGITKHPAVKYKISGVDVCEHIQSYFIAFKKSILLSEDFNEYWKNFKIPTNYDEAVAFFELYTTDFFVKRGYKSGAYINIADGFYEKGLPYFYDVYEWIDKEKLPFVKKKIFAFDKNIMNSSLKKGIVEVLNLIYTKTEYDINFICDDVLLKYAKEIKNGRNLLQYLYILLKQVFSPQKKEHYKIKINCIKQKLNFTRFLKKQKTKKRILLVSHDLSLTGAPIVLLDLAKYLFQQGFEVDVVTYKDGISYELEDEYKKLGIKPAYIEDKTSDILKFCLKNVMKYNLVICNTIVTYRFANILKNLKMPVVWYIHETKLLDEYYKMFPNFAKTFSKFDKIYSVSKYAANVAKKYNSKIKVIPNGIDNDFEKFNSHLSNITFGYIGSFAPVKGVDILVNAFIKLLEIHPDAKLIVAGMGFDSFAEDLVKDIQKYENISLLGQVSGQRKKEFFNNIDVLCVPSLDDPAPLTVLEGSMYGKTIITTAKTGSKYVVNNNESGFILDEITPDSICNAMNYFCNNPEKLEQMQKESRKMYLEYGTKNRQQQGIKQLLAENLV